MINDLQTARQDAAGAEGAGGLSFFNDPQFLTRLMTNPRARELLKDPETAALMKMMQQNPNNPAYVLVILSNRNNKISFAFQTAQQPEDYEITGYCTGF